MKEQARAGLETSLVAKAVGSNGGALPLFLCLAWQDFPLA